MQKLFLISLFLFINVNASNYELPVYFNNQFVEFLYVEESLDNEINIPCHWFKKNLFKFLYKTLLDEVNAFCLRDNYLSKSKLQKIGFDVNLEDLSINISMNSKNLPGLSISLYDKTKIDRNLNSDFFSGYLNFYYQNTKTLNPNEEFQLDLTQNIYGYVINSKNNYIIDNHGISRSKSSNLISKNFEERNLSIFLGDIFFPGNSLQTLKQIKGVSFSHFQTPKEKQLNYIKGSKKIFIEEESNVSVYINNLFKGIYRLKPGTHQLKDFNLEEGNNSIRIEIDSLSGKRKIIDFNILGNQSLLKKGIHEFSYAYGQDEKKDFIHSFHQFGLFDELTIGAGIQSFEDQTYFTTENKFSSILGLTNLSLLFTENSNKYNMQQTLPERILFGLNGEIYLNIQYLDNQLSFLTTSFNSNLNHNIFFNIGYSKFFFTNEEKINMNFFFNLTQKLNLKINSSLILGNKKQISIYALLNWTPDLFNVQLSKSLYENKQNITTLYTSNSHSDSIYSYLGQEESLTRSQLRYFRKWNQFESYFETTHEQNNEEFTLGYSLGFSTALVWTSQSMALSKTISDSFVILDLEEKEDYVIEIDNIKKNAKDYIGPIVFSDLNSYSKGQIYFTKLSWTQLNQNKSFTKDYYLSSFSGLSFKHLIENTYSYQARLIDSFNGEPLKYILFKLIDVSTGEEIESFTDDKGYFFVDSFKEGSYTLILGGNWENETVIFPIPSELNSLYFNLGDIGMKK